MAISLEAGRVLGGENHETVPEENISRIGQTIPTGKPVKAEQSSMRQPRCVNFGLKRKSWNWTYTLQKEHRYRSRTPKAKDAIKLQQQTPGRAS